jgi:hypothetical protein
MSPEVTVPPALSALHTLLKWFVVVVPLAFFAVVTMVILAVTLDDPPPIARPLQLVVDDSMTDLGSYGLGRHRDSSGSFDFDVEVTAEWRLPDRRLHVVAREWREDGYEVELWVATTPEGTSRAAAFVRWSEQSGSERGLLDDLGGSIRMSRELDFPSAGADAGSSPLLLEYELHGTQRNRFVHVRRKLALPSL